MRRTLVVLAVSTLLVVAGACSDDEGGFDFGGESQGQVPGQTDGGGEDNGGDFGDFDGGGDTGGDVGGTDSGAFSDASMSTFVASCMNFDGATQGLCECAWGQITSTVPAEEYAAFEEEFLADSSIPLPDWLTSAVGSCSS